MAMVAGQVQEGGVCKGKGKHAVVSEEAHVIDKLTKFNMAKQAFSNGDKPFWSDCITEILYSDEEIQKRVAEMGTKISKDYAEINKTTTPIILVGLLKGSYMFLSDLSKRVNLPVIIDVMNVRSYSGKQSTGTIKLIKDLDVDPTDKHVLICEDLIDTGTTLAWLKEHLKSKKCASVKISTLIRKITPRRKVKIDIDYCGFECEDQFIVGYGMDYDEKYRNLPFVGVLDEKVYMKKSGKSAGEGNSDTNE